MSYSATGDPMCACGCGGYLGQCLRALFDETRFCPCGCGGIFEYGCVRWWNDQIRDAGELYGSASIKPDELGLAPRCPNPISSCPCGECERCLRPWTTTPARCGIPGCVICGGRA